MQGMNEVVDEDGTIIRDLRRDAKFVEMLDEIDAMCFQDMVFAPGSETWPYVKVEMQMPNGEWCEDEDGMYRPALLRELDVGQRWLDVYEAGLDEDVNASTDLSRVPVELDLTRTDAPFRSDGYGKVVIRMGRSYVYDKSTLAHELIHFYETYLLRVDPQWRDMMLISLYDRIRDKIPNVSAIVKSLMHSMIQSKVNVVGGLHTPLFLLKSLDIDMKLGFPQGTTFGYGHVDQINKVADKL